MYSISSKQHDRANLVIQVRLSKTPIYHHPAFKYSLSHSGYKNYVFGAMSGPRCEIENLLHELAHGAEFIFFGEDFDERCTQDGSFHFAWNQTLIGGRLYNSFETIQATMREIRTFAMQLRLLEAVGYKFNLTRKIISFARILNFQPDWVNVPGQTTNDKITWCAHKIYEFYNNFNPDQIVALSVTWLDHVQLRLESAAA